MLQYNAMALPQLHWLKMFCIPEISGVSCRWQAQKEQLESSHEAAVRELTKRTQKVRDRTLGEMAERDQEIARLRSQLGIGFDAEGHSMRDSSSTQRRSTTASVSGENSMVDELRASGPLVHTALEEVCEHYVVLFCTNSIHLEMQMQPLARCVS